MKKIIAISLLAVPFVFSAPGSILGEEHLKPLDGKIIALDAGHGGDQLGAQYPANCAGDKTVDCLLYEKDINIVTVHELKKRLEEDGASVVLTRECDEKITGRRARVNIAKDRCADFGGECDILTSVHHNGNINELYDGTLGIYNNPEDLVLATHLHEKLLEYLFANDTSYDEGFDKGGYGMTVYFTPASLTEGYYVTNKCEAELFLQGTVSNNTECSSSIYGPVTEQQTTSFSCAANDTALSFDYGSPRVDQEVEALYQGLLDYFGPPSPDDGGGTGGNCPPAKEAKGKC